MEEDLKEKMASVDSSSTPTKGGLRTMPFIIGNEALQEVSGIGLRPNMIFYLISDYHLEAATASILISIWSGMSGGFALFGAFLSDSYLGRFRVIALGSFLSLLGTSLLWLTTMVPELKPLPSEEDESPTSAQIGFLFSCFVLMAIGSGCVSPCSMAFGADQLVIDKHSDERLLQSFFNWYYGSIAVSALLAVTVLVYIQDQCGWQVGFGIPMVLMLFSVAVFVCGSSLFVKVPVDKSLFTGFVQVMAVAIKKRNITLPPPSPVYFDSDDCYYHVSDESSKLDAPTQTLRCLNKACVITDPERDLNPDGSASCPWNLCSVDQVECSKALLRIIPIWSTTLIFHVCQDQSSFASLQAKTMDRHISSNFEVPAASFSVILILAAGTWIAFYVCVFVPTLARYTSQRNGLSPIQRMAIGHVFSFLAVSV